ncbi:hypothetical protein LCR01_13400 [Companilactobacillus crustorum]|nr:hypothetical protein LCR01_13400 [Companilactobacillus crustorum]
MIITRHERKIEDSRLTRLNNKKSKNANLRRKMTILGSSMFVGAAVAEISNISTVTPVKAEALSVNNLINQNSNVTTTPVSSKGVGDQDFIDYIGNSARKLASNNDLYASVMIAQAMVESGWGTSGLASAPNYNLFGIKGDYNGSSVNMGTQEDDGTGNLYSISSNFRNILHIKNLLKIMFHCYVVVLQEIHKCMQEHGRVIPSHIRMLLSILQDVMRLIRLMRIS